MAHGIRIEKYIINPSGIVTSNANRPTEIGPQPLRIRYRRPSHCPSDVEATDGHTVITVASEIAGGNTPAIAETEWLVMFVIFVMAKPRLQNAQKKPHEKKEQQ